MSVLACAVLFDKVEAVGQVVGRTSARTCTGTGRQATCTVAGRRREMRRLGLQYT